jgi:hypothetical protein
MPFPKGRFVEIRPYLYHSTCIANLKGIRQARELRSATSLIATAHNILVMNTRRDSPALVDGDDGVWLQTQRPLHKGNIALEEGFTFENLVSLLNSKVFFWPGTVNGPINYAVRHLHGNDWPNPAAMIRVRTQELFETSDFPPEYCAYNSGSPRCVDGRKSPRGPNTFRPSKTCKRSAGKVVEVVFSSRVTLPNTSEIWNQSRTKWTSLFDS